MFKYSCHSVKCVFKFHTLSGEATPPAHTYTNPATCAVGGSTLQSFTLPDEATCRLACFVLPECVASVLGVDGTCTLRGGRLAGPVIEPTAHQACIRAAHDTVMASDA